MKEINLKGLNEVIYYDECSNGLKVYMWVNQKVNTFYGTLSIKYGSVYNNFKVNNKTYKLPLGVPHFLEHVKFNEKKDWTAHDYYNKTGCDTNAFTTFKWTNYQVYGTNNPKDNIIHLLDFVQNNYFTKSIIKNEKGIIIEESNMTLDDPYSVLYFSHLNNIFNNYDYKYIITGSEKDIKEITLEDIKLAFESFYHPQNMFLVITGNFNPYELMASIKDNQNNKQFSLFVSPQRIIKKEGSRVNVSYEKREINVTNQKINIGIKIPKSKLKEFDDFEKRLFLNIILKANFGSTSDLKNELLEKELISSLYYSTNIYDDYIVITISIDTDYEEEVLNIINNRLDNLNVDEKTFNRMKKSQIANLITQFEDVEYVNSIIQFEIINYDHIMDDVKSRLESINFHDIKRICESVNFKERCVFVAKPLKQ